MSYCTECGKKNAEKAKFCAYCGAQLTVGEDSDITSDNNASESRNTSEKSLPDTDSKRFLNEPTFESLEKTGSYKTTAIISYSISSIFLIPFIEVGGFNGTPNLLSVLFYGIPILLPTVIAIISTVRFFSAYKRNMSVLNRMACQQCRVKCYKCGKTFDYCGDEVRKSRIHSPGLVNCPNCQTKIGHSTDNIVAVEENIPGQ